MWKIIYVKILNLKKNYKPYLFMLMFPLIFTFIFGLMTEGENYKIKVPVVDMDNSDHSRWLLEELDNIGRYQINLTDREKLSNLVSENTSPVGLIIPENFGEDINGGTPPRLDLVITAERPEVYSFEGALRASIQKIAFNSHIVHGTLDTLAGYLTLGKDEREGIKNRIYRLAMEKWEEEIPIRVKEKVAGSSRKDASFNMYTQSSVGFAIAFSMFTFIFAIGEILEEKENGVWNRINISPLSKFQIYTGNLLYACAVGFIQLLIMAFVGDRVFGVDWGGNIGGVLAIFAAFTFCIVSLGLLMSSVIKNRHQLQVIAPVVVVSTSMIGGCYWPLEIVSSRMLIAASKFVPQGWAVKALKDLIVYNRGFEVVYLPAAVLILMGVVFLGTALQIREKGE